MHEHTVEVVEFNICRQFINPMDLCKSYINKLNSHCNRINFDLLNSELKKAMKEKPLPDDFSDDDLYEVLSSQDCAFFTKKTPMGISKNHIFKGLDTHDFGDGYAYIDGTKEVFKKKLALHQVLIDFLEDNFNVYKPFLQKFQQEWNSYARQIVDIIYFTDEAMLQEWFKRHKIYKIHFILGFIFFSTIPFQLLLLDILGIDCLALAVIGLYIEPVNIFWGIVIHPAILKKIIFDEEYPYDSDVLKGCGFDEKKTKGAVLTGAAIGKFLK